ncbi:hypothetical protein I6U48_07385 [Clostridium sp. PL3]|uniref:Spore coat protein n=1 Tax=Clostridium thailandense TaxID=2794346 RepID=A0A949TNZ3_9CLOT|nr:hypothetical protein [Clostridium thailandense]MBV7272742.1 hypothetical protein [Clostridium thailandense]
MQSKQIEANNLKVIEDQLNHESLMNKKINEYSGMCTDSNLKNLCTQAASIHKQNFNSLKSYLDSHQ